MFLNCSDSKRRPINLFLQNADLIDKTCKEMDIDSRKYASIILAELSQNYNWLDEFDYVRAENGFDASVGITQMRVSTFIWIEDNYQNKFINKSNNYDEVYNKISSDSINIVYSVFYVKLINDSYLNKYKKYPSVEALGSYYARGIDYGRDNIDSSYANLVGQKAGEIYTSNLYIDKFHID